MLDGIPNDWLLWGLIAIALAIIGIGIPALYYYRKRIIQPDHDNFKLMLRTIDRRPHHLRYIVAFTVGAGTLLMILSMFVPGKPDATKDILPFATGLVGFLGGLVTVMFRTQEGTES